MTNAGSHIFAALKAARLAKRLSQRALSESVGMPQSHISKIEQGAVDLQLSSLFALARALDLEAMLVPRKLVPAVEAIAKGDPAMAHPGSRNKSLPTVPHAYSLDGDNDA